MLDAGKHKSESDGGGNYIFRACFIDPFQGAAMANFAMKADN